MIGAVAPSLAPDRTAAVVPLFPRGEELRVLVVEDHELLAQILVRALHGEGMVADLIGGPTGAGIVAFAARFRPDVVLLDLDLGDAIGSGVPLIEPLIDLGAAVVMLTGATNPVSLAECIEAGAAGLLGKDTPFEEVVAAVRGAAAGGEILDPGTRHGLLTKLRAYRSADRARLAPFARLTERESQVLMSLTRGLSAADIASESFVSIATVRSQIRAVLVKLGVTSQLSAVAMAVQSGWTGR